MMCNGRIFVPASDPANRPPGILRNTFTCVSCGSIGTSVNQRHR